MAVASRVFNHALRQRSYTPIGQLVELGQVNVEQKLDELLQAQVVDMFRSLKLVFAFDFLKVWNPLYERKGSRSVKNRERDDAKIGDQVLDVGIASVHDFDDPMICEDSGQTDFRVVLPDGIAKEEAVDDVIGF